MSHSERDIGRMADRHNDNMLNEHLDGMASDEQREERVDAYVAENMNDRILAWLSQEAEGVLFECVSETSAEETNDAIAARMIMAMADGDDSDENNRKLGEAFYKWMRKGMEDAIEPELRDEAERELGG